MVMCQLVWMHRLKNLCLDNNIKYVITIIIFGRIDVKKKERVYSLLIVLFVAIVLSLYFYNQLIHIEIPIHSDDAGTAIDYWDIVEMGSHDNHFLQPFSYINLGLYYLLGANEVWIDVFFAVKYGLCIVCALFLTLRTQKGYNWWLLPLFIFMCMPGSFGTASIHPLKFHVWTMFVPLLCISYVLLLGDKIDKIKIKHIIVIGILSLFGIVEKDILIVVTCWLPFVIFWLIHFYQNGYIKKYCKQILFASTVFIIVGRLCLNSSNYAGYGANSFPSVEIIFQNIVLFFTGIQSMFNINLAGNDVIQFSTIINCIRLILLILAIYFVIQTMIEIKNKKIDNISSVDALIAISTFTIIFVYIFLGCREDEISIRYATYLYYLLIIILCRKIYKYINKKEFIIKLKKYNFMIVPMLFCVLIGVSVDPINFTREENSKDIIAKKIGEIDSLENGLGSFWDANVISCLSGFNNKIQAVEYLNGEVEVYLNKWEAYQNGRDYFNFFIEDKNQDFGINRKNLEEAYGDYLNVYSIEDCNIYEYDYDIRTKPLIINYDSRTYLCKNDYDIIKNNKIIVKPQDEIIVNNLYFTIGKVRFVVKGDFEDDSISLSNNQYNCKKIVNKKNEIVYEMTIDKLDKNCEMVLSNMSSEEIKIDNIKIERIDNYVSLSSSENEIINISPGDYIFAIEGESVKESGLQFEVNGNTLECKKINCGRKKVAYRVSIQKECNLKVIKKIDGNVTDIYYQNEILNSFNNPNITIYSKQNGIRIKDDKSLLYGPYVEFEKGNYILDIYGQNINQTNVNFTVNGGTTSDVGFLINKESDHLKYIIKSDEKLNDFEVIISNINAEDVNVFYYTIENVENPNIELEYLYNNPSVYCSVEKNKDAIVLKNGDICYGPYIDLLEGKYEVEIQGENLLDAEISITADSGKTRIDGKLVNSPNSKNMIYQFDLVKDVREVEVVINNTSNNMVKLYKYSITELN